MKLFKKNERSLNASHMRATFRKCGYTVIKVGTYCKWKDLPDGGRLQVELTIYRLECPGGQTCYMVEDALGRVATELQIDKAEVMDWLEEHGYKTEKRWYLEDYGMSEETWAEWNCTTEV